MIPKYSSSDIQNKLNYLLHEDIEYIHLFAMAFSHSRRSKSSGWDILWKRKKEMLSLQRMSWAIVEELHRNTADGDELKAYIKSPRYWKTQHFSSLIAFYIIGIPTPLAGNQQQPWELSKAGSELTPALSFPLPPRRYFLSGRWGVKITRINLKGYEYYQKE